MICQHFDGRYPGDRMNRYARALQRALFKKGQSVNWLSQKSGVSFGTISGILYGGKIPRIDTAHRLCRALDAGLSEVFEQQAGEGWMTSVKHAALIRALEDTRDTAATTLALLQEVDPGFVHQDSGLDADPVRDSEMHSPPIRMSKIDGVDHKRKEESMEDGKVDGHGYLEAASFEREGRAANKQGESSVDDSRVSIRFVEDLAAGNPRLIPEEMKKIEVPIAQLPAHASINALIAFKLKGESMSNLGFHDGDIVFAVQDRIPEHNNLVVAYVHDFEGCTFKRLTISPGLAKDDKQYSRYTLCWEDGSGRTQIIDPQMDTIIGVYTGRLEG